MAKSAAPEVAASAEPTAEPVAAPIKMSSEPTPEPTGEYGDYTQDEFYVASISSAWRGALPADAEFVGAAALACQDLTAGAAAADVRVVSGEGEDADWNNDHAVQYAVQVYCPEFAS
ncbi:DUF732 domain-containing protein [Cryobacterium soli]|uniref:DUF732 domain-containing protein n=1 Tax=Cryobacterium soli TaxID=2220095 RepID=UPI000E74E881|nr:DUF732 domain-containing protein [Cryobacterium soli]